MNFIHMKASQRWFIATLLPSRKTKPRTISFKVNSNQLEIRTGLFAIKFHKKRKNLFSPNQTRNGAFSNRKATKAMVFPNLLDRSNHEVYNLTIKDKKTVFHLWYFEVEQSWTHYNSTTNKPPCRMLPLLPWVGNKINKWWSELPQHTQWNPTK